MLYLVRHGEAVPKVVDPKRPLSPTGREHVQRVATFLAEAGVTVGEIWHSGKRRAEQTAAIIAEALGAPTPIPKEGVGPHDPVGPFLKLVTAGQNNLMVVGHLPFLAFAAASLLTGNKEGMVVVVPPGGVICLEDDGEGHWALRWMVEPGILKDR